MSVIIPVSKNVSIFAIFIFIRVSSCVCVFLFPSPSAPSSFMGPRSYLPYRASALLAIAECVFFAFFKKTCNIIRMKRACDAMLCALSIFAFCVRENVHRKSRFDSAAIVFHHAIELYIFRVLVTSLCLRFAPFSYKNRYNRLWWNDTKWAAFHSAQTQTQTRLYTRTSEASEEHKFTPSTSFEWAKPEPDRDGN